MDASASRPSPGRAAPRFGGSIRGKATAMPRPHEGGKSCTRTLHANLFNVLHSARPATP
jgi:hypothetical protein